VTGSRDIQNGWNFPDRPCTLAKNNNSGHSLTASKSVQSSLLPNYLENGKGYEHVLSIKCVFYFLSYNFSVQKHFYID